MFSENFAFIGNYICRESIKNINKHLSEQERKGFSNHDYYYLTAIRYMGEPTFTQVAQELGLTKSAISLLVKKLSEMNLVEKVRSDADKRVYHIRLTEKGCRLVQGDEETYDNLSTLFKNLLRSEAQYKEIDKILSDIVKALKDTME